MRKMIIGAILLITIVLSGCEESNPNQVTLPDLDGYSKSEIEEEFEDLNVDIYFVYHKAEEAEDSLKFIGYGQFYLAGDEFDQSNELPVIIYDEFESLDAYFFYEEITYDGPYLDMDKFEDIDPVNPRGGYFTVTNPICTDGDTAVFTYPSNIYSLIESNAKSTRFLNMDTEETFPGGEEEWGKVASEYTCMLLDDAEDIILQTDPGDELLGNYGRLLSWVWLKFPDTEEYVLLNYMVVRQGLAQVKYEFGAGETISYGDHTYNEWMHIAEDKAMLDEYGQWGDLLDYYWDYEREAPNEFWD